MLRLATEASDWENPKDIFEFCHSEAPKIKLLPKTMSCPVKTKSVPFMVTLKAILPFMKTKAWPLVPSREVQVWDHPWAPNEKYKMWNTKYKRWNTNDRIQDTKYELCNQLVSTKSQFSRRAKDDTAPKVVEVSLVLLDQEKGKPKVICEVFPQSVKCLVAPEKVSM